MEPSVGKECQIEAVGKQRNGRPRFWCTTHQSSATGKYGRRLDRCEGAYRLVEQSQAFELDPSMYPGGVALWGAVRPVYDTSGLPAEEGVHVHARQTIDEDHKAVDGTYPVVSIPIKRNLIEASKAYITVETAVASYISRFLGRPMLSLFCTYCGEPHLDSEWFAVKLHKRHLCHACGKIFLANEKCVSNPLERLRYTLRDTDEQRESIRSSRRLDIAQSDYEGGVQIWASNPALLWTAPKPEMSGIHVHCYDGRGARVEDDTFSEVVIDGCRLDEEQLGYFMAQQSLSYLNGKIAALRCGCGQPYFDRGHDGFRPHLDRTCSACGSKVAPTQGKRVVSNPFVETIAFLREHAAKRDS